MSPLPRRLLALLLLALCLSGGAATQDAARGGASASSNATAIASASSDAVLDTAGDEITLSSLRSRLSDLSEAVDSDPAMRTLLPQLNDLSAQADKFVAARTAQLVDLNARLGELGNAPSGPGVTEDADITRQRNLLLKQRNALDSDVRLAKLLAIDAQQRGSDLLSQRRKRFEAQLTERAASPLGSDFWLDLADAWPQDIAALRTLATELRADLRTVLQPAHRQVVLLSALAALALATFGNALAEWLLVRLATRVLPPGRLRRSMLVILIVGANVLLVALAAHWLAGTLKAQGALGVQSAKVAEAAVAASVFMAFVVGLGRALLSNRRPSWRLPPITNPMAKTLAPFPWLIALVGTLVWIPTQINALVNASFAAVVATHVVTALALTALVAAIVLRLGPDRAEKAPATTPAAADAAAAPAAAEDTRLATRLARPPWVGVLLSGVIVLVILIWLLVATGYVALASLLSSQLNWAGIVAAAFYVLFKFADDLFMALVSSKSSFGGKLQRSFDFSAQSLDQAAIVLSGVSRVALFFYMLIALAAPLGTGPDELFQRSSRFGTGLTIGEFKLVPAEIFAAIGVALAGFIALRVFKHWLSQRLLPSSTLEAGMQSSITTLLGYIGAVLVVAFTLSALGIGINRIAWVASALSVGIGFGLQAIVQNFISGLILLAERPVKVGDWVVLGTTEGDVRRINVRATEIQLGDRSTVIVPNSEFITKTVRNMTLGNAEGRALIRLPMPLSSDAQAVRTLMLEACNAHPLVLASPEPSVSLEGIENASLIFQAIAYVPSPRVAGGVRSDLLFSMLDALRQAGLPLAVPAMALAAPTPPAPAPAAPPGSAG